MLVGVVCVVVDVWLMGVGMSLNIYDFVYCSNAVIMVFIGDLDFDVMWVVC